MELFEERFRLIRKYLDLLQDLDAYKELPRNKQVDFNCNYIKDSREGEYLIKVSRKNKRYYIGEYNLYIAFNYSGGEWLSFMCRKNAQWFTGKEAQEFIKHHKGFTIVKR